MTGSLALRIGAGLDRRVDPAIAAFATALADEADALGILFYGSNLRTGSLEGVLDFYVLLSGSRERGIWPRVSYREWRHGGAPLRAKIATMTLETFASAARGDTMDTTIWARFVQPSALIFALDGDARARIVVALADAARTAGALAVALGPDRGMEGDYWAALFRATYRAELRVEKVGREDSILSANRAHFDGLLPAVLADTGIPFAQDGHVLSPRMEPSRRRDILSWWNRRQRMGKGLNMVRLMKAAFTFDGAARYAAWKIHRHTGIAVEVTPFAERHPILAAPGLLWKLRRARKAR